MGLFKSKESRHSGIIQEASEYILTKADAYGCDDTVFTCLLSWVTGSSSLATCLLQDKSLQTTPFGKAWGKGNRQKALSLLEVCLYPMLSIWFAKMKEQGNEQSIQSKTNAIKNIQYLLETESEAEIRDFINLDIQYNYDMDKYENELKDEGGLPLVYYSVIFMSKMAKSVGLTESIDWEKQTFPVRDHNDLKFLGQSDYLIGDWRHLATIPNSILLAGGSVFTTYQQWQNQRR